tara:strand:+ start:1795 stop:3537 length:1743 start_codon:yes stop_codon:yes gene_type:complete
MISKSYKNFLSSFFLTFIIFIPLKSEEQIDIWKNNKKNEINKPLNQKKLNNQNNDTFEKALNQNTKNEIKIKSDKLDEDDEIKIFGIYDPADYNFNLNMWSATKADDVRASLKRLKKIKLSKTSKEILENILLSYSYPPIGMEEKEFVNLKVNWLIDNNRSELIETFLQQNNEFYGKSKVVQYLVDENISSAKISEGCKKIKFIDSNVKDSYLEKFKIYCLVFNNKKSQAQLLLDLLREQKQSDKFFDDKIDYLLGITNKTSNKVDQTNLLNFYLSSITIKDFNFEPTSKTKKEIWKYLSSANLIKFNDLDNKQKLNDLEIAANNGQVDKDLIFNIYKQLAFDLNTLINASNVYQTLDGSDARALIYQKFLLSENIESKLEYLFLLEDLFKKEKKQNIYANFLSDKLKEIGLDNVPENYQEIVAKKLIVNKEIESGKIRYNDKILHQSKIIKYFIDNEDKKKIQKDINKIFKKLSKNRKYFYSAKDLALVDALVFDGFKIPENFDYKDLASEYVVPENLEDLIKKNQNAFLALRIVEIIGEDEPHQLDPETIYFITNLFNEMNLYHFRNKVLISALPLRV